MSRFSRHIRSVQCGGAVLVALIAPAYAGESLFGYVYTTDTHPKGTWELEQWSTLRTGKSQGEYNLLQLREELEYGVTDNFQLSGYVNTYYVNALGDNVDGTTGGPFVPESADPNKRYSAYKFDTVSIEAIYRILSPYADPIGLAVYFEPSFGPNRYELEGKVIAQKNFLDDRLVWAGNLTIAPEWEHETGNPNADPADPEFHARWERSIEVEFTTGVSYRFAPGWFGGLEFRNHNEFEGLQFSKPEHSAFFLGPVLHYGAERWWATLTFLPQLPFAKPYNDENREVTVGHRIFGDEHERAEIRLKFGLLF